MHKRFYQWIILALALGLLFLLTACGGATATPEGSLPRTDRVSARDIDKGTGVDICGRYDKPDPQPFDAGSGTPLKVIVGEHIRGEEDALITILMYGDFQCEECAPLALSLKTLVESRPGEVRVAFRHYPMDMVNDKARLAALATEVATDMGGQDAFWEMHDWLYEHQSEWSFVTRSSFRRMLVEHAAEMGLDSEAFSDNLTDEKYGARLDVSLMGAQQLKVAAAPKLFINDSPFSQVPESFELLDKVVEVFLLQLVYSEPPPLRIDPDKDYVAWIVTEKGDIAIDLYADLAPETVNSFVYLACMGYHDNTTWHYVIPGFIAQAGDPTGTGLGAPGYAIPDEFEGSALLFDRAGLLSMGHGNTPDSAGSQFFITLGPVEDLNGAFTIFGQVVKGMDVLTGISPRDQASNPEVELPPGDLIITIIVREV